MSLEMNETRYRRVWSWAEVRKLFAAAGGDTSGDRRVGSRDRQRVESTARSATAAG